MRSCFSAGSDLKVLARDKGSSLFRQESMATKKVFKMRSCFSAGADLKVLARDKGSSLFRQESTMTEKKVF
jgi:hypothetical protein